jgi:hypothetical protein
MFNTMQNTAYLVNTYNKNDIMDMLRFNDHGSRLSYLLFFQGVEESHREGVDVLFNCMLKNH